MTREEQLACLTERPCEVCKFYGKNGCGKWNCVFEEEPTDTEPCEDAISRDYLLSIANMDESYGYVSAHDIAKAPSVTPKQNWIPVNERLPEPFSFVNCTCHSLIDDREDWVVETCYLPLPPNSPYSDWGNIPMLNWRECEVIAWMYRDIPEPYKSKNPTGSNCTTCILDGTDACSRGAGRAVDGRVCEDFIGESEGTE